MDERTAEFLAMFRAFMTEVVQAQRNELPPEADLIAPPAEHLGTDPTSP
jgi:hypothetical protein